MAFLLDAEELWQRISRLSAGAVQGYFMNAMGYVVLTVKPEELDYQDLGAHSHRTLREEGEGNVPKGRRCGPAAAAGCRGGLHRRTAPVDLGSRTCRCSGGSRGVAARCRCSGGTGEALPSLRGQSVMEGRLSSVPRRPWRPALRVLRGLWS